MKPASTAVANQHSGGTQKFEGVTPASGDLWEYDLLFVEVKFNTIFTILKDNTDNLIFDL